MSASDHAPRYRNQAAQRVLAVLGSFIGHDGPRSVTEIARELKLSKNMVHRALSTLVAENYLARDVTGERYQLGLKLLSLTQSGAAEFDIVALARPALEALHAVTGESVYLSIIVGRNRVTVDDIQAQGPRVLRSPRGHPVALHCTKMSRTLLAHLSDTEIDDYLKKAAPLHRPQRFPDPASESAKAVWRDIEEIRSTPYVLWRNPHLASAAYAIFPVLDETGHPHAIVTVGGPRERFDLDRIKDLLPQMRLVLEPLERQARLISAPPFLVDS
ncbi:MAG TPA: IclR family transcriptional regulator [Micropepsaceae bacterium]|jgi:DNA-binding IclR family transcriptional regulator|nr:IclR family transcriptional regulator [Micropepsaceae bacterium]